MPENKGLSPEDMAELADSVTDGDTEEFDVTSEESIASLGDTLSDDELDDVDTASASGDDESDDADDALDKLLADDDDDDDDTSEGSNPAEETTAQDQSDTSDEASEVDASADDTSIDGEEVDASDLAENERAEYERAAPIMGDSDEQLYYRIEEFSASDDPELIDRYLTLHQAHTDAVLRGSSVDEITDRLVPSHDDIEALVDTTLDVEEIGPNTTNAKQVAEGQLTMLKTALEKPLNKLRRFKISRDEVRDAVSTERIQSLTDLNSYESSAQLALANSFVALTKMEHDFQENKKAYIARKVAEAEEEFDNNPANGRITDEIRQEFLEWAHSEYENRLNMARQCLDRAREESRQVIFEGHGDDESVRALTSFLTMKEQSRHIADTAKQWDRGQPVLPPGDQSLVKKKPEFVVPPSPEEAQALAESEEAADAPGDPASDNSADAEMPDEPDEAERGDISVDGASDPEDDSTSDSDDLDDFDDDEVESASESEKISDDEADDLFSGVQTRPKKKKPASDIDKEPTRTGSVLNKFFKKSDKKNADGKDETQDDDGGAVTDRTKLSAFANKANAFIDSSWSWIKSNKLIAGLIAGAVVVALIVTVVLFSTLSGHSTSNAEASASATQSQESAKKLQSHFNVGDKMDIVYDGKITSVTISDFNDEGATAKDSSGHSYSITNSQLKDQLDKGEDSDEK